MVVDGRLALLEAENESLRTELNTVKVSFLTSVNSVNILSEYAAL